MSWGKALITVLSAIPAAVQLLGLVDKWFFKDKGDRVKKYKKAIEYRKQVSKDIAKHVKEAKKGRTAGIERIINS